MDSPKYLWIQTRDGSPTLWSNDLGESFRSVKGAFAESWCAFVEPALTFLNSRPPLGRAVVVGEFGLGPGTNWVLWSVAAARLGLATRYFVIERDLESFALGLERWRREADRLNEVVTVGLGHAHELAAPIAIEELAQPEVFASLDAAITAGVRADLWFHDPFGFDVNPDGYLPETLARCARLWNERVWGGSYACNRQFRDALAALPGLEVRPTLTGDARLKRERLEFSRG